MTNTRLLTTIFVGMAAGILGFDGPLGVIFYFICDYVISLILLIRFRFKPRPYYTTWKFIAWVGLKKNVMTFMVIWVLFYNVVYIL